MQPTNMDKVERKTGDDSENGDVSQLFELQRPAKLLSGGGSTAVIANETTLTRAHLNLMQIAYDDHFAGTRD